MGASFGFRIGPVGLPVSPGDMMNFTKDPLCDFLLLVYPRLTSPIHYRTVIYVRRDKSPGGIPCHRSSVPLKSMLRPALSGVGWQRRKPYAIGSARISR